MPKSGSSTSSNHLADAIVKAQELGRTLPENKRAQPLNFADAIGNRSLDPHFGRMLERMCVAFDKDRGLQIYYNCYLYFHRKTEYRMPIHDWPKAFAQKAGWERIDIVRGESSRFFGVIRELKPTIRDKPSPPVVDVPSDHDALESNMARYGADASVALFCAQELWSTFKRVDAIGPTLRSDLRACAARILDESNVELHIAEVLYLHHDFWHGYVCARQCHTRDEDPVRVAQANAIIRSLTPRPQQRTLDRAQLTVAPYLRYVGLAALLSVEDFEVEEALALMNLGDVGAAIDAVHYLHEQLNKSSRQGLPTIEYLASHLPKPYVRLGTPRHARQVS